MNLYILMPWGVVEVKKAGQASFGQGSTYANVKREGTTAGFVAHVDTSKFPIVFADEPPTITRARAGEE
jgi:hypothetical protein